MDKDNQEHKKFLEEQLEWCKKQDRILEEIDMKLHEMKKIAEYALEHEFTSAEIAELNGQLNKLKSEVYSLEQQLYFVIH
ncbi:polyhydroxyalkanoate synthesis regulator phasin [Bacillus fengqiuensis]|nr:polyhydroxyalkanoate synthesis regulator phasin [Bacillus fengqiuensis]